MTPLLECKALTKKYGNTLALNNINLTLERGRIIGLLGPNASGKTTLIKLINGLLTPTGGEVLINGQKPGPESKLAIAYLPDTTFLCEWMNVEQLIDYYKDFYNNFDSQKAYDMLARLNIGKKMKLKAMSKGTKEKVQLILTMSRKADLYCLDEPIGGVDPASRDYILETIINNYNPEGSILISTHLISDIEKVLDEIVLIQGGNLYMHKTVDEIREEKGMSIDGLFREVFRC
ncbi:MAG: ABC transporter ATP-binding protein [Lachnospiraceae bacterium]|nr:ABC transporter ATP-binding protein [Lachnospiraceae bacterium]